MMEEKQNIGVGGGEVEKAIDIKGIKTRRKDRKREMERI